MKKGPIGYRGKIAFLVLGLAIFIGSLMYSNYMVRQLREKETRDIQLFAHVLTMNLAESDSLTPMQAELVSRIISANRHTPAVIVDEYLYPHEYQNIDPAIIYDPERLPAYLDRLTGGGTRAPIALKFPDAVRIIYYDDSPLLKTLRYFPWIQLSVFGVFIALAAVAFRSSKHNEQNRVWVGMAKETAHQLGTPTSSLLGWIEYLRTQPVDPTVVDEMSNDIARLLTVVDRFSKIGAETNLSPHNIYELVCSTVNYFRARVPRNVALTFDQNTDEPVQAMVNEPLLGWVFENLLKNALDALPGKGSIGVNIQTSGKWVCIDVTDTGKGIAKGNFKRVFEPGYSTKTRGWGLGLSLCRRIVEEYHHGRIFVLNSEVDKGTTMRVMVKKL